MLQGAAEEKSASRSEWRRRAAALSLSGFCLSFGSPEPLPEWLCSPSTPPPRGSSFGELQSRSKGLEGDKTDSGLEFSTAAEGRHKPPPSLYKCFIAHVEGGAAAHISSMTSSWFDLQSEREGRDEELKVPLCLVCGWTMNSWVFGSISLLAKVSLSQEARTKEPKNQEAALPWGGLEFSEVL